MPAQHTDWTVEMVHALPDNGTRYEVVDGELFVTPAPSRLHQRAVRELILVLGPYAARIGLELLCAPYAIKFSPRREVQPDLVAFPLPDAGAEPSFIDIGSLLLAVEILSSTTRDGDRHTKRPLYQSQGVAECWMVDVDARVIERWRPADGEPELLRDTLVWQPLPTRAGLEVDVFAYFRRVHGEQHD